MSVQSMISTVDRSIKRYGTNGTLHMLTDGAIDFDTGKAAQTETTVDIIGVLTGYASYELVQGVINIDDTRYTIRNNLEMNKGDKVTVLGNTYVIINIARLIRAGTYIKTTLQLRESSDSIVG